MIGDQLALRPNEQVQWSGQPTRVARLHPVDALVIPLYLAVGTGFTLSVSGVEVGGLGILPLFRGLVYAMLVYSLAARLVLRRMLILASWYVVTNQRLIVRSTLFGWNRESNAALPTLGTPAVSVDADGVGTISFGEPGFNGRLQDEVNFLRLSVPLVLYGIADAREVRDLIVQAQVR